MADSQEHTSTWTVGRLLEWTTGYFAEKQVEGGRLAAELLLAKALGCQKIELYTRYTSEPDETQRSNFRELVQQAGAHVPIAYLIGHREFFSLDFEVTPAVLIPRPETEAIVQRCLDLCKADPAQNFNILDVGTGSGCIAIAIQRYASNAKLTASDISADALEVARRNADRHEATQHIRFIEADGLDLPTDTLPDGGFDIIVSNPPYIDAKAFAALPPHIREHEPRLALNVCEDGLSLYRQFAEQAPSLLAPDGRLLIEIAFDASEAVKGIFTQQGLWSHAGSFREPTDAHERVLEFTLAATGA
jgi:release factor glutamine methyltransferase